VVGFFTAAFICIAFFISANQALDATIPAAHDLFAQISFARHATA
jgi:hypothetical protein